MTSSLRELGHLFLSEWIWARLWKGGCKLVLQVSKRGKNGSSLLSAWMSALVNRQAVFPGMFNFESFESASIPGNATFSDEKRG